MSHTLHEIYKSLYQRSHREPWYEVNRELSDACREIVAGLWRARDDELELQRQLTNSLELVQRLMLIEAATSPRTVFTARLYDALRAEPLDFGIPPLKQLRWDREFWPGTIYVALSTTRQNRSKLGVTTSLLEERIRSFRTRFGEPLVVTFSALVRRPFEIEHAVSRSLSNLRISSNTHGISNEWYACKPKILEQAVREEIALRNAALPDL